MDGSLLWFRPFNAIARMKRINRPSVIFTNRHRSRCCPSAGGSGFGHMRDSQKKEDHECCAAHSSFIARIFQLRHLDEEREGASHALMIFGFPFRYRRVFLPALR